MSDKYKIFLVTKYFYPILTGAAKRFFNLYPYLKQKNVELSVITIKHHGSRFYEEINGIKIFRKVVLGEKYKLTYELQKSAYRFATKNKPDAIIFLHHSYSSFMFIALLKMKNIICIRNVTMMPAVRNKNIKSLLKMYLSYNVFSKVYCLNEAMRNRLISNGLKANKTFICTNGVNTDDFTPLKSDSLKLEIREKLELPKNLKIILFVGYLIERKGVDLLLDAWSKICGDINACLVIVGSFELPDQKTDLKFKKLLYDKIDSIDEEKLVIRDFTEDILKYYLSADIFAFLSKKEGMPNALLEAMSCGLTSIITPFDGLSKEFGKDRVHYYKTSYSVDKIALDLKKLINDKSFKEIGKNASLHIKERFSIQLSASKLIENIFLNRTNY